MALFVCQESQLLQFSISFGPEFDLFSEFFYITFDSKCLWHNDRMKLQLALYCDFTAVICTVREMITCYEIQILT